MHLHRVTWQQLLSSNLKLGALRAQSFHGSWTRARPSGLCCFLIFPPSPIIRGETDSTECDVMKVDLSIGGSFPSVGSGPRCKQGTVRYVLLCSMFHTEDPCGLFKIWVICGCTDLLILLGVRKSELRKATNSFSLINGSLIFYSTFC